MVRHFVQGDERLKLAKIIIFNTVHPGIERPTLFCSPSAFPVLQPAGAPFCAARQPAFQCSPPARSVVQSALMCSPPLSPACRPALLFSPPLVQLEGVEPIEDFCNPNPFQYFQCPIQSNPNLEALSKYLIQSGLYLRKASD